MVYNIHHFIAYQTISAFFCLQLTSSTAYSQSDPDIVCGSSDHDQLKHLAIFYGVIWLIFIPLHMIYYNERYQHVGLLSALSSLFKKRASTLEEAAEDTDSKFPKDGRSIEMVSNPSAETSIQTRKNRVISSITNDDEEEDNQDNHQTLKEERWKKGSNKHIVFVRDFKFDLRYWHVLIFLRKTVLPIAIMISDRRVIQAQAESMLFIIIIFYFLAERCRPFWLKRFNNLDTLSSEVVIISLVLNDLASSENSKVSLLGASLGLLGQLIFYFKTVQLFIRIHREEKILKNSEINPF
jgi:hypothetical protein